MKKNNIALLLVINAVLIVFLNIAVWLSAPSAVGFLCTAVSVLASAFVLRFTDSFLKKSSAKEADAQSSTGRLMLELPVPSILCGENDEVLWYNTAASDVFSKRELAGCSLASLFPEFKAEDGVSEFEAVINHSTYEVNLSVCGDKGMRLVTLRDITLLKTVTEKSSSVRPVVCYITVDNYSEAMTGISANEAGKLAIEIEEKLVECADNAGGVIHRLDKDRFVLFIDMEHLVILMADKFGILASMREIKGSNDMSVTVSIGVGFSEDAISKSAAYAKAATELALGRGGDQAVVKLEDELKFFGGSSRETEKKTKVRARVMAQALCEIIDNAYQVIIMGHKNPDADSFGAAVGIFGLAESMGVRARIVIDDTNSAVKKELERFREWKEYSFAFITADQALGIINEKTVIVLVDTHRADRAELPGLLNLTSKTVVIDHHRRSADYIKNTILTYHEPYASSTCEMVAEILQYTDYGAKLKRYEAEALFAGVMLDTKNFAVKTGVRTFDAAAFLRKRGADPLVVRELFKTDFEDYKKKMDIVSRAVVYRGIVAISNADTADLQLCAAAADELLEISGVKASFVMCRVPEFINISARSDGSINVQLIAESLGGGGHMTVAGAQIPDCDAKEAEERLKNAIDSYFAESY